LPFAVDGELHGLASLARLRLDLRHLRDRPPACRFRT
jgi:hypothetical protein